MPHLHLSLQAGADLILKRMKRRHSRADAIAAIARARALRPGIAIGADLIAGFPTETEALFADTLALVTRRTKSRSCMCFPTANAPARRRRGCRRCRRRCGASARRGCARRARRTRARFFAAQIGRDGRRAGGERRRAATPSISRRCASPPRRARCCARASPAPTPTACWRRRPDGARRFSRGSSRGWRAAAQKLTEWHRRRLRQAQARRCGAGGSGGRADRRRSRHRRSPRASSPSSAAPASAAR